MSCGMTQCTVHMLYVKFSCMPDVWFHYIDWCWLSWSKCHSCSAITDESSRCVAQCLISDPKENKKNTDKLLSKAA